ncbi:MAG TPA: hypothetical protein VGG27_07980 [Magnetospirillaceae bacterium]|jgi:hypothetical protein
MPHIFAAIHQIAAQRGEGLRPKLLELLQRSAIQAEIDQATEAAMLCGSDCMSTPSPETVTADETK